MRDVFFQTYCLNTEQNKLQQMGTSPSCMKHWSLGLGVRDPVHEIYDYNFNELANVPRDSNRLQML